MLFSTFSGIRFQTNLKKKIRQFLESTMYSWKCVWLFIKMCLRNIIFFRKFVWFFVLKICLWNVNISTENVSELFSKFVCKMSKFLLKIVSFTICVWKMTMFLLKNCLNCFQTLSAKCFPESVSDHYQNLSAKLQYFSSKLVWIVFKICLRNNWQRWFNISNWNSGQICFYSTNKWSTS